MTYTYSDSKELRLGDSQALLTTESALPFDQVVKVSNMIRFPNEYISAGCNSERHLEENSLYTLMLILGTIWAILFNAVPKLSIKVNPISKISTRIFVVMLAMIHPVLSCTWPGMAANFGVYVDDSY